MQACHLRIHARIFWSRFDTDSELSAGTLDVFENVLSPLSPSTPSTTTPTTSTSVPHPNTHHTPVNTPTAGTGVSASLSSADLARYWSTLGNLLTVGNFQNTKHSNTHA